MNETQFVEFLALNKLAITEKQLELFKIYYEELVEYNKKVNLTSITDKEEIYLKHFYDSLTILFATPIKENSTICDVGAGAGFPSIPLKIMRPDINITIVDSLGKRIEFLKYMIEKLNLNHIEAINSRAEDFSIDHRETFDIVTARAVARLNILSELCIPLVKLGGHFIAMKALSGAEELRESKNAIQILGCELTENIELVLPLNGGTRNIAIITKKQKTPNKYPRNYSQIKNKPL